MRKILVVEDEENIRTLEKLYLQKEGYEPVPAATGPKPAALQTRVEWNSSWERVRPWEFIAGPLVVGGALTLRFAGPQPERNWRGGILFDDAITNAIAVRSDLRGPISQMTDFALGG